MTVRLAIAIGDPNGIGPEIAVKAAAATAHDVRIVLVGDAIVIEDNLRRYSPAGHRIDVCATPSLGPADYVPGQLSAAAGAATVEYVRQAVKLAQAEEVDAVMSCPCSETAVNMAGIPFAGFQPLIAELTGTARDDTFMMLVADGLRIAHVTLHEGVASAMARMTPVLVAKAARATDKALRSLGCANPRIAMFGINPHAGENGLFGSEDERVTKPAAALLQGEGLGIEGPFPADLVLSQRRHDAYLAMFHDQGHIPIKLVSPLRATSLTIGTPILFASVAHGCAHDIAGTGQADPTAMQLAVALLANNIQRRHE
ncbi:MAG: terephthalate dihydrodiol dehydrogenase [Hyphomicrobiales bacterium]|nr:MAG: terephthalate dihydrodiol dehydrogenase [Hyphomicrobiales bacterium]